ncbi:hypothetical protein AVEN_66520-1 [Araneus ventricosus]|uniref:H15 domain-containing protein n=1 Tax=Araneus ventricosus TaxID=182803 RepID=A0A4Y2EBI3_ARAVE|nr:hypothetical protein AVEN_66520-1 [Araneus ventricosus]
MTISEKAKVRKWMLMADASSKGSNGVTIHHMENFLDSKQSGLSSKPETKLILKNLVETGRLAKKDGEYAIKKSKKKTPGKEMKRSKSPLRNADRRSEGKNKATTRNKSKHAKSV